MPKIELHQRLLLIGYRGTGKTTVAIQLAEKTGRQWIDLDAEIIRIADCSIQSVFDQEGEDGFRNRETSVLRDVLDGDCTIVACGGGIVQREENRQLLKAAGKTILLQALPETLCARIEKDHQCADQRPPLTNLSTEAEIREILKQRSENYLQCAQMIIDTETKTSAQVAEEILANLENDTQSKT